MALLGQHYSASCQNREGVRKEILLLIDHRWRLTDSEREWCSTLLSEDNGNRLDDSNPVQSFGRATARRRWTRQMGSVLQPEDFSALAQCLGWFDTNDGAMTALVRDLPGGAERPAQHLELFPEQILVAFAVLGCDPTLDLETVKRAHKEKMKVLHPDTRVGVDLDERERAEADSVVSQLSDASKAIKAHFRALSRASSEPTSRPPPSADAANKDKTWNLTARTRELAQRVQQTVEATREIIKEAEQRIDSARNRRRADIAAVNSLTAEPRQQINALLELARAHLAAQGVEPSRVFRPEEVTVPAGADLRDARAAIADLSSLVHGQVLKAARPKQPWRPDSDGGGCATVILAIVAGAMGANLSSALSAIGVGNAGNFIGFFVGFAAGYGTIMWWLHHDPVSTLESVSTQVQGYANQALAIIDQYARETTGRANAELQSAEDRFRADIAQLDRSWQGQAADLEHEIDSLWADAKFSCAEWNAGDWDRWSPSSTSAFAARFATLTAETADLTRHLTSHLSFVIPALAPFPEGRGLLLKASGAAKDGAAQAIQGLLARLLATVPPAKLRFIFIDPVALGSNVAAFMPLADHEETLVTSRAWSEPHHIEQRLGDVTEHMETVIQKYLRTEFETIHDYNEAAKEVAEPYRFVVVFDFPVNFTDTAARRLTSIARSGARCGVYSLILCDSTKPLPHGFSLNELQRLASVIETPTAGPATDLRWADPDFQSWRVQLDSAAPHAILMRVIDAVGALAKDAMKVEVPYHKLLSLSNLQDETWWKATTANSIRVPLGPTGARKLQYLVLGEGMGHHVLIVGRPGSGKSNLMHVIITTLALTYSPWEIRLYLIDFKKGVEFKSYADLKLPHAEAIAIESEREFGLSVVDRLDVELKRRGDLFRRAGSASISEYREKTGRQIPRVLLLVDEFQEFFTQDDHVARQTTLILDRLVRQGRAFGIHIILGSQTLAGSYNLSRSTLDQMAVRIAMQCSEADSRLVLSDENPAARLLSRPGEAIYNAASGLVEGNNLFQVARFSEEDGAERLGIVARMARDSGQPVPVPIVFDGNELAQLVDCGKLQELLSASDWPGTGGVDLLLGDPIAIKDPVAARIRRQSGAHLLILSRDEAEGVGMCIASITSVLLQQRPADAQVFIADFTVADSEWEERAEDIERHFPHRISVLSRQRDVAELVKTIAGEVRRRSDAPREHTSIYLIIQGMHRLRVLRGDDESFAYEEDHSTPSEHFATILRDGPEVGIHVICWCDTYSNANRVADRRMMAQFGLRASGAMSADDSLSFFDDAAASRIDKPHRIIFFDEERPGQLEKFRPYSIPPREWLEAAGRKLRLRCAH